MGKLINRPRSRGTKERGCLSGQLPPERTLALRQNTAKLQTEALQSLARINNSHRTRSAEHRGLTGTEGTYASQSQFEEELLSFCKYYTMAVEKKTGFLTIITVLLDLSKTTEYVIESGTFK